MLGKLAEYTYAVALFTRGEEFGPAEEGCSCHMGGSPNSSLPLLICRQDKKALEILPSNLLVQLFYSERMPTYFEYGKMLLLF